MSTKNNQENDKGYQQNNKKILDEYGKTQKIKLKNEDIQREKIKLENIIQQIKKGDIIKVKYQNKIKNNIENPILIVRSKIYESKYKAILGSGGTEIAPYGLIKKERNKFFLKRNNQKHKIIYIDKI